MAMKSGQNIDEAKSNRIPLKNNRSFNFQQTIYAVGAPREIAKFMPYASFDKKIKIFISTIYESKKQILGAFDKLLYFKTRKEAFKFAKEKTTIDRSELYSGIISVPYVFKVSLNFCAIAENFTVTKVHEAELHLRPNKFKTVDNVKDLSEYFADQLPINAEFELNSDIQEIIAFKNTGLTLWKKPNQYLCTQKNFTGDFFSLVNEAKMLHSKLLLLLPVSSADPALRLVRGK